MEERSHHQRNRTAPRGAQAPHQNPDGAAVGRDRSDVVLGTARLRSDHYAQSGRMAQPDPRNSPIRRLTLLPDHVSSSNRRSRQSNSNTNRDGTLLIASDLYQKDRLLHFTIDEFSAIA